MPTLAPHVQRLDVAALGGVHELHAAAAGPVVGAPVWRDAALVPVAPCGGVHRHHANLRGRGVVALCPWDVHVHHAVRIEWVLHETVDHAARDRGGASPRDTAPIADVQAHRDRRHPEERSLDRRRHGARVDHVDADIGAAVHAADHDIGPGAFAEPVGPQCAQRQLHAVRRRALDRKAARPAGELRIAHQQRMVKRDAVALGALHRGRRDHEDLAHALEARAQRGDSGSVNAVIVREKYSHGLAPIFARARTCGRPIARAGLTQGSMQHARGSRSVMRCRASGATRRDAGCASGGRCRAARDAA